MAHHLHTAPTPDQSTAAIDWRAGDLPVSVAFDDPYFSLADGWAETRHVFLDGNDLAVRLADGQPNGRHVAELGFGTGLNLLALAAFRAQHAPATRLAFTSFEAYPMAPEDQARALAHFPELERFAKPLLARMRSGARAFDLDAIAVRLIIGDACTTLPAWEGRADAWFLDGFAPARNPQMWAPELMQAVADHTHQGGTFATYTAAGHVRRALAAAGFAVTRAPGFGTKRHMSRGVLE